MQHVKDRWAETHLAEWPDPTHERHCRHPEAAHAASEIDNDAPPPLTRTEARLVALVWIASAVAVVIVGARILARWGVL